MTDELSPCQDDAGRPRFSLKLAKESVNQVQEAQGLRAVLRVVFSLQQLGHADNHPRFGTPNDPSGL